MQCEGCGLELRDRSGRGRRARFCGPACRQRAHRARVADGQAELLGALDALALDVGAARRAVLSGVPVSVEVRNRLGVTADVVVGLLGDPVAVEMDPPSVAAPAPASLPDAADDVTEMVTKTDVTEIVTDAELLQRVAGVYLDYAGNRPAAAVARFLETTPAKASVLIRKARRAGLLLPSRG